MRKTLLWLCCGVATLASTALAQDKGLTSRADALGGPFWQARFDRDASSSPLSPTSATLVLPATSTQTLRLLGDYQFSALRLGDTGGLRLTGGLLINLRAAPLLTTSPPPAADTGGALPYAGIGYASAGLRGGWGFSADLGLAALSLGSPRLDRWLNGGGNIDTAARLQPMFRLGMNVAF